MQKKIFTWLFLVSVFIGAVVFTGCGPSKRVALIPELMDAANYFQELERWTREDRNYGDLELRYTVKVTYLSAPLLKAYVAEYARQYQLNSTEQQALYEKTLQNVANEEAFFVAIFAPAKNADKIDLTDDVWRLRLGLGVDNDGSKPTQVKTELMTDPRIPYFFPYVRGWTRNYRVTFPGKGRGENIAFSMQGVIGGSQFSFNKP